MLPWAPPPRGHSRHLTVGTTLRLQSEPARRLLVGQKENSSPRKTQRASSCTQALIPVQNDISRAKAMSVYLYSGSTYAATELGRNPVSKHQIQPEYGDEQADAGRDGWTHLARPNSQARTGTGEYYFPCSADHEQDWQPYPVGPYSAICDDHTYIHTYIQYHSM